MKLSDKVKNILKKHNIEYEDMEYEEIYDKIVHKMKLQDFNNERCKEYFTLEEQLNESLKRKYVYLLIEKIKNNIDNEPKALSLGEIIKDMDKDFLIDNIDLVLKNNNLDDLLEAKEEERRIRLNYLEDLVDKKYYYLLLEYLEST